jgi:hypothetical protein
MDEAREIYDAARVRWLAESGGSYAGLHGILIGVIAKYHPELLIEAARYADQLVSVDRIVEESLGGGES